LLPNIQELIYQQLQGQINALKTGLSTVNTARERAEVAGGFANLKLAQLPVVNNTGGDVYYATDGCKPGEAVGHGTGVAVYWDSATNQWLRIGDYQSPSGPGGNQTANTVLAGPVSGPPALAVFRALVAADIPALPYISNANENANTVLAGPTTGVPATPTFRALVAADIPVGSGSPLTTKGDLYGYTTTGARVPVGADNQFLVAASAQATGLQYRGIVSADLTTALTTPPIIGGTTPAAASFTTITGTGLTDIAGTVRSTGNTSPTSGQGIEMAGLGASGGVIIAYDRGASSYLALRLESSPLNLNTVIGNPINTGTGLFTFGGNANIKHLIGGSAAPTAVVGPGAGTLPSIVSPVNGTDAGGIIDVTTGTATVAAAVLCKLTFAVPYGAAPRVVLFPANGNAADVITGAAGVYVTSTANDFSINTGTAAPTISKQYQWYYHVLQ